MNSIDSQPISNLDELYEQYKRELHLKSQYLPSDGLSSASKKTVPYHPNIKDELEEKLKKIIHCFTEILSNSIKSVVNLSPRINTNITNYISETELVLANSIINYFSNHEANITADILHVLNLEHNKVLEFFESTPLPNYNDQSEKSLIDLLKNTDKNISEYESDQKQTDLAINNIAASLNAFYHGIINQIKILIDGTTSLYNEIDLKTLQSFEQRISNFKTISSTAASNVLNEISELLSTETTKSYSHAREVLERRKSQILQAVGLEEMVVTNNSSPLEINIVDNDPKPQPPEPPIIDIFDPNYSHEEYLKFLDAQKYYYDVVLPEWEARHPEKVKRTNPTNESHTDKSQKEPWELID